MRPQCPHCQSRDTLQVDAEKAECLDCGEVFAHPADDGSSEYGDAGIEEERGLAA